MNIVVLFGRLGKDPEIKESAIGEWAKFSLATSSYKKSESGERETDWHDVCVYGYKNIVYLKAVEPKKGDRVLVKGHIAYNKKEGKQYTNIIAESISFISSGRDKKVDAELEAKDAKDFETKMDMVKDVFPEAEIPF